MFLFWIFSINAVMYCGSLNVASPYKLRGTIRRWGLAEVGVVSMEEGYHCGDRL